MGFNLKVKVNFSKLSIVVEEADETEMWLDLLKESEILPIELANPLHLECVELFKNALFNA